MDWKNIPSLSALRAFEATGRLGNQSHAARELNVSQAGIAQHIRALETHFATKLISREGRGISLTPEGTKLYTDCNAAFSLIAKTSDELLDTQKNRPVTISLTPKFAEIWLMPRIADFWNKHPNIEVSLRPSEANVDLSTSNIDLAIRFGEGEWPNTTSHAFIPMKVVIVATPEYLEKNKGIDFEKLDWLVQATDHRKDRVMDLMNTVVNPRNVREFPTTGLLHEAILNGLGVGALNADFMCKEIEDGTVKIICRTEPSKPFGYHFLTQSPHLNPKIASFICWINAIKDTPDPEPRLRP